MYICMCIYMCIYDYIYIYIYLYTHVYYPRDTGLSKASAAAGRGGVPALRLADALDAVPAAARDGPVLTLELAPGSGLAELYGNPANFKVQEESILRQEEVAQRGGYSAHDLYSGRSKHMSRALAALEESPGDRLRALVDGKPEENTSAALPSVLAALGFASLGAALEVFSVVLNGEGAPLLVDLQRAQCGAAGTVLAEAAAELRDVLRRHADLGPASCVFPVLRFGAVLLRILPRRRDKRARSRLSDNCNGSSDSSPNERPRTQSVVRTWMACSKRESESQTSPLIRSSRACEFGCYVIVLSYSKPSMRL